MPDTQERALNAFTLLPVRNRRTYVYSKLRRISDVIKEMKAQDPDSPVSWYFLRELCKKGKITTLKFGNSWLINVDELYAFFKGGGERK